MIPAAILLVVAAVAFAEATGTPAYQLLVAVVGVPLFLLWFVRALVRIQSTTAPARPAPRTIRGQIVVTRVAEPVYRTLALPYSDTAVRALPAAHLRLLEAGWDEAVS